jgi:molybdopterin/thiamine biosynthesis adenylyltransferase
MITRSKSTRAERTRPQGASVGAIGLGNIGSHAVPLAAALAGVSALTLVDPDRYSASNLASQDIERAAIGRRKVDVQAERVRRINPDLTLLAICAPVEHVPLGLLRADVLLAGLDSGLARLAVNRIACWLGIPWIDAGVQPQDGLASVAVYFPSHGGDPCYECQYDAPAYAAATAVMPCQANGGAAPPTNAPRSLGALAAAWQALELQKLLAGLAAQALAGRELLLDTRKHIQYVTAIRRNPSCRSSHQPLPIQVLDSSPAELTLGDALALGEPSRAGAGVALGHLADEFARRLVCQGCGRASPVLRLGHRLTAAQRACRRCRGSLQPSEFHNAAWLDRASLEPRDLRRTLASLGFLAGDVFALQTAEGNLHYEFATH